MGVEDATLGEDAGVTVSGSRRQELCHRTSGGQHTAFDLCVVAAVSDFYSQRPGLHALGMENTGSSWACFGRGGEAVVGWSATPECSDLTSWGQITKVDRRGECLALSVMRQRGLRATTA